MRRRRKERRRREKRRTCRRRRRRGKRKGRRRRHLSISVSSVFTSCPPCSLVSKIASHSSKNKMASLILASRNMNLKFSPADILPSEGKLMRRT